MLGREVDPDFVRTEEQWLARLPPEHQDWRDETPPQISKRNRIIKAGWEPAQTVAQANVVWRVEARRLRKSIDRISALPDIAWMMLRTDDASEQGAVLGTAACGIVRAVTNAACRNLRGKPLTRTPEIAAAEALWIASSAVHFRLNDLFGAWRWGKSVPHAWDALGKSETEVRAAYRTFAALAKSGGLL